MSLHQCSILINLFIHFIHSFIHSIHSFICCWYCLLHSLWSYCGKESEEIPVCYLFQAWKLIICSRIIHPASGSTGWTVLLNVLLSYGVFKLGVFLQQTHNGFCHLLGSYNSFFKGKRVWVSLILKICFPVICRKGLHTCSEESWSQSWVVKLSYTLFQLMAHRVYCFVFNFDVMKESSCLPIVALKYRIF